MRHCDDNPLRALCLAARARARTSSFIPHDALTPAMAAFARALPQLGAHPDKALIESLAMLLEDDPGAGVPALLSRLSAAAAAEPSHIVPLLYLVDCCAKRPAPGGAAFRAALAPALAAGALADAYAALAGLPGGAAGGAAAGAQARVRSMLQTWGERGLWPDLLPGLHAALQAAGAQAAAAAAAAAPAAKRARVEAPPPMQQQQQMQQQMHMHMHMQPQMHAQHMLPPPPPLQQQQQQQHGGWAPAPPMHGYMPPPQQLTPP